MPCDVQNEMEFKIFFEFACEPRLIELPINPSELKISKSGNIFTYSTVSGTELAKPSGGKLAEIRLSGVLPSDRGKSPIYFTDIFQRLINTGEPIVVSIARRYLGGTSEYITLPVLMESFVAEERGGSMDISYSMGLREYRYASISKTAPDSTKREDTSLSEEITKPATAAKYVVKRGDTLYSIAKRLLGDGNRFMEIARLNGIANPNLIRVGQELTIC